MWQRRGLSLCQRGSAHGLPCASRLACMAAYLCEGRMVRDVAVYQIAYSSPDYNDQ